MKHEDKVAIAIDVAQEALETVEYLTLSEWNYEEELGIPEEELADIHDIIIRRLKVVCKK